jgi:hypothetical protein
MARIVEQPDFSSLQSVAEVKDSLIESSFVEVKPWTAADELEADLFENVGHELRVVCRVI